MMTLDQRLSALPPNDQSLITGFVEYLEWKRRMPGADVGRNKQHPRSDVGARLIAVREALGQTQEQAASVAGIALATYERYERGNIGRWATAKVLAYADTWNVSLDWLIAGTGQMFVGGRAPEVEAAPQPSGRALTAAIHRRERQSVDRPAAAPSNLIDWTTAQAQARVRKDGGAK